MAQNIMKNKYTEMDIHSIDKIDKYLKKYDLKREQIIT